MTIRPSYAAGEELAQLAALAGEVSGARAVAVYAITSDGEQQRVASWGDWDDEAEADHRVAASMGGRVRGFIELVGGDPAADHLERVCAVVALALRNSALAGEHRRSREVDEVATLLHGMALSGQDDYDLSVVFGDGLRRLLRADGVFVATGSATDHASPLDIIAVSPTDAGHGLRARRDVMTMPSDLLTRVLRRRVGMRGVGALVLDEALHRREGPWMLVPAEIGTDALMLAIVWRDSGDAQPFTSQDEWYAQSLCLRAATALRFGDRQRQTHREWTQSELDRVAADLHDLTIQRLYGIGMMLQAALRLPGSAGVAPDRAALAIDQLNEAIVELRGFIAGIEADQQAMSRPELVAALSQEVDRQRVSFAVEPELRVDVPADVEVPWDLARALLVAAREGLSNAARHGEPQQPVILNLSATGSEMELRVVNHSAAAPAGDSVGRGLRNLTKRARAMGGGCTLTHAHGRTELTWWVDLSAARQP